MAVTTNVTYINRWVPAYHAPGKYAYKIGVAADGQYWTKRANNPKYRSPRKVSGPYATMALAQTACDTDLALIRPSVTPTTTTAGYTQPAIGSTVVVPVASATGILVGMRVAIATGGTYDVTVVAAPNLTLRNIGSAEAVAPTTAVATAKTVTAVAGPG